MDVFVYTFEPLSCGRDVLEDALEEAINGIGEITGGGSGQGGSNIDIKVFDDRARISEVLGIVKGVLIRYNVPNSTVIDIDGNRYRLCET